MSLAKGLALCPFCGSHEIESVEVLGAILPPRTHYAIKCTECGTFGPKCKSKKDAKFRWNYRFSVPSECIRETDTGRQAYMNGEWFYINDARFRTRGNVRESYIGGRWVPENEKENH